MTVAGVTAAAWVQSLAQELLHATIQKKKKNQKTTNNKCLRGCGKKGILLQSWWECKFGVATMENSMEVP